MRIKFLLGAVHRAWYQVSIAWHRSVTIYSQRGFRPMQCSAFAGAEYTVLDRHLDIITPVGFDQWLKFIRHDNHRQCFMLTYPWVLVVD